LPLAEACRQLHEVPSDTADHVLFSDPSSIGSDHINTDEAFALAVSVDATQRVGDADLGPSL
jgi:hypothetical protein